MFIIQSGAQTAHLQGAESMSRPPFRNSYFIANTLLLFVVLACLVALAVKEWRILPLLSLFALSGVAFGLAFFWTVMYRMYRAVYELLSYGKVPFPQPRSPADLALGIVAGVSFYSLMMAFGLVAVSLMAMFEALAKH